MSTYHEFTHIRFMDRDCLLEALRTLGFGEVEIGTDLPLYGYQGDRRVQMAEVVVRRRHIGSLSNDLGFARRDGALVPIISEYDARTRLNEDWQRRLKVAYAQATVQKIIAGQHGTILRDRKVGDRRHLKVQLYRR